jgi:hypothetical protein
MESDCRNPSTVEQREQLERSDPLPSKLNMKGGIK